MDYIIILKDFWLENGSNIIFFYLINIMIKYLFLIIIILLLFIFFKNNTKKKIITKEKFYNVNNLDSNVVAIVNKNLNSSDIISEDLTDFLSDIFMKYKNILNEVTQLIDINSYRENKILNDFTIIMYNKLVNFIDNKSILTKLTNNHLTILKNIINEQDLISTKLKQHSYLIFALLDFRYKLINDGILKLMSCKYFTYLYNNKIDLYKIYFNKLYKETIDADYRIQLMLFFKQNRNQILYKEFIKSITINLDCRLHENLNEVIYDNVEGETCFNYDNKEQCNDSHLDCIWENEKCNYKKCNVKYPINRFRRNFNTCNDFMHCEKIDGKCHDKIRQLNVRYKKYHLNKDEDSCKKDPKHLYIKSNDFDFIYSDIEKCVHIEDINSKVKHNILQNKCISMNNKKEECINDKHCIYYDKLETNDINKNKCMYKHDLIINDYNCKNKKGKKECNASGGNCYWDDDYELCYVNDGEENNLTHCKNYTHLGQNYCIFNLSDRCVWENNACVPKLNLEDQTFTNDNLFEEDYANKIFNVDTNNVVCESINHKNHNDDLSKQIECISFNSCVYDEKNKNCKSKKGHQCILKSEFECNNFNIDKYGNNKCKFVKTTINENGSCLEAKEPVPCDILNKDNCPEETCKFDETSNKCIAKDPNKKQSLDICKFTTKNHNECLNVDTNSKYGEKSIFIKKQELPCSLLSEKNCEAGMNKKHCKFANGKCRIRYNKNIENLFSNILGNLVRKVEKVANE